MLSDWTKALFLIPKKTTSPTATTKIDASRRRRKPLATRQPKPARREGDVASATATAL
jgi:hypothetical protein